MNPSQDTITDPKVEELNEALERFYKLKTEEKKQRLLEEVRNVELLW